MTVLLLGAGGFLGLNTFDALKADGVSVRCGRRKRSNVLGLRQRNARLVEADLDNPDTLTGAMQGCDTVIHLAGHYPRLSNTPDQTVQLGVSQTHRVLDAAATSGVRRLIYVSSTATVARHAVGPSTEADVFARSPEFGTYHSLKWAMESVVVAETRFETITVCPGACLGAFDWKVGTSAVLWQLLRHEAPVFPEGIVSWVDAFDVGKALSRLVTLASAPPRILLAAGNTSFHELVKVVAHRYGAPQVPPPLDDAAAIAFADQAEARAAREGGRPRLSRELVDLIIHGVRIDATLSKEALGLTYRPLQRTLEAFEAWAQRMGAPVPPRSEAPQ